MESIHSLFLPGTANRDDPDPVLTVRNDARPVDTDDPAHDEEPGFVFGSGRDIPDPVVPQRLGLDEGEAVFAPVRGALLRIEPGSMRFKNIPSENRVVPLDGTTVTGAARFAVWASSAPKAWAAPTQTAHSTGCSRRKAATRTPRK